MNIAIIDQWDAGLETRRQRVAIQLSVRDAAADAQRVFDQNFVPRRVMLEHNLEARPLFRDARSQEQARSLYAKSKDPLEAGSVHPAGRAGIPRPTAAPDVRSDGIYVGGDHVGFHLI